MTKALRGAIAEAKVRATAAIAERILTGLPTSYRDRFYETTLSLYRRL